MGSFLLKCNATKNAMGEGSSATVLVYAQPLQKSTFKNSIKSPLIVPKNEFHRVFSYNVKVQDYGNLTPTGDSLKTLQQIFMELQPKLVPMQDSHFHSNIDEISSGEVKASRKGGTTEPLSAKNLTYIDRYPLDEVLDYIAAGNSVPDVFWENFHYNINGLPTVFEHNNELFLLRTSVYKAGVIKKCLGLPMEEHGKMYNTATDYVDTRIQAGAQLFLPSTEKNALKEYLKYEYLFKMGLPTGIVSYAGQDYGNSQGKAYKQYVTMTK